MAKVSKRLRYEILRRDGFRCRYCGAGPAETELRVDHVVPVALGGDNKPSNLATACEPCNSGKTSTTPDAPVVADVTERALQWTSAMQAAAAAMEKKIRERRDRNQWFEVLWEGYRVTGDPAAKIPMPADWSDAITRLEAAGLTYLLFEEAVATAMKAYNVKLENRFRYFCGVAWNLVTQLQEAAQQVGAGNTADGEATPWANMSRDTLESTLWCFGQVSEDLLTKLPSWIQESAERATRDDCEKAGEPDLDRIELLPHVLRHVSDELAACEIRPAENKDN